MAKATIKMPEVFLSKLSALGEKTDEAIPRILQIGGKIVLEAVRDSLTDVIGNGTAQKSRSTGELLGSLGVSPAKLDKDGNYNVKIGFSEPRSDGKSNAMIANVLEYGKSGQAPKPFLAAAKAASKAPAIAAMKSALEEELMK